MNDIALALTILLGLLLFLCVAGILEYLYAKRWTTRTRKLEQARADWAARMIEQQSFWKQP